MRDDGQLVGIVSMDLSKGFDVMQHPLLKSQFQAYGLDEDSCVLLRDRIKLVTWERLSLTLRQMAKGKNAVCKSRV